MKKIPTVFVRDFEHSNGRYVLDQVAPGCEWVLAGAMGILFAFGNAAYGIGAERLGSMGPILGWPAFMAMQVVAGNALGLLTGEWRGAGAEALRYLAMGNVALVIAIFMIAPASS